MDKENHEIWEKKIERRAKTRAKKKKPQMKVSGASVKSLQKIIISKR
jgi:hypothetical protein